MLDKGVPTGGKHCVPLANIFLSFIMRDLIRNNETFRIQFENQMKLWKRFIDDCGGVYLGRDGFGVFFNTLHSQFNKFELQLTYETSPVRIHLLDLEIFIDGRMFHTREHRKETATNSYVKFGSAHPKHCFKGIVKSQMIRLRRLCSRDSDFVEAIAKLRQRCINSGYDVTMVDEILGQASTLNRELTPQVRTRSGEDEKHIIRWVVLSGTAYEKQIKDFTGRINRYLDSHNIRIELVNSTGSSIGKLLFNNNVRSEVPHKCNSFCVVCNKGLRGDSEQAVSPINGRSYRLNQNLNCMDGGIYAISCACTALYTGKTTTAFNKRFCEHFRSTNSAVFDHSKHCQVGKKRENFSIQFLENVQSRGKYSLSEREYLWNSRLRGIVNIQKTLLS